MNQMHLTNAKAAVLTIFLFFSMGLFSQVKIGVINPQQILSETNIGKNTAAMLEKLKIEKQKEIEARQKDIAALEKELLSPALNADTRESKTLSLQDKRTELKRLLEDAQKEMQMKSQKELAKLYQDIMPIIDEVGKSQGFTIIFDVSTSGISFFDQALDITNQVIAEVNKKLK
jgi:outer membrane protein